MSIPVSRLLAVSCSDFFVDKYNEINHVIMDRGDLVESRNGDTREILNFKTMVNSPIHRCVGGNDRDPNIFFLLAEAMWIWSGRKDVSFLSHFNSRMSDYSDDGKNFNAPYGFRMRHWGVSSFDKVQQVSTDSNKHAIGQLRDGTDQLLECLRLLAKEPETRRAVISIWNPDIDLNRNSKDLPCNDLLMFQERRGKLHLTISNRSNDLHWGLTTNIFQFSWVLENMCLILGKKVGTQTHNSKSLHVYVDNPIHKIMSESKNDLNIYNVASPMKMDFSFPDFHFQNTDDRLYELDKAVNEAITIIEKCIVDDSKFNVGVVRQSCFYTVVLNILLIYVDYTKTGRTDVAKLHAIGRLNKLDDQYSSNETLELSINRIDFIELAMNWMFKRIKNEEVRIEASKIVGPHIGIL